MERPAGTPAGRPHLPWPRRSESRRGPPPVPAKRAAARALPLGMAAAGAHCSVGRVLVVVHEALVAGAVGARRLMPRYVGVGPARAPRSGYGRALWRAAMDYGESPRV